MDDIMIPENQEYNLQNILIIQETATTNRP